MPKQITFSQEVIIRYRLQNQQLVETKFERAEDVVRWMGAVQAQDFAAAKWAVGQRTKAATDSVVEKAFADGALLRTHVMRPTWHFVAPEDIRWLLKLTAPRVHVASAYQYRRLELDQAVFKRSNHIIEKALQGGKQLTRDELGLALKKGSIPAIDLRLTYIVMRAELDGVICSGARRGKQFTYALLDGRAPKAKTLTREEALAELTARYFRSHGPAALQDFAWWSGLMMADAKAGLEMVKSQFTHESVNDQTYWFSETKSAGRKISPAVCLLPNYDEYVVGYTDRSAIFDTANIEKLDSRGSPLMNTIIINGQIAGIWKRTLKAKTVEIDLDPFKPLTKTEKQSLIKATERFGKFLKLHVTAS
ncbi:MAG TPA: winged helix DNA-binding domain-containing protein [Anaerolineales bacterium]